MVSRRRALESLYVGTVTITEHRKVPQANKTTAFEEMAVLRDQPCRLSFSALPAAGETDTATGIAQSVKVFLAPEITVKPGSKLTITQHGVTAAYKRSGAPAVYASHQEIRLELFDGWS